MRTHNKMGCTSSNGTSDRVDELVKLAPKIKKVIKRAARTADSIEELHGLLQLICCCSLDKKKDWSAISYRGVDVTWADKYPKDVCVDILKIGYELINSGSNSCEFELRLMHYNSNFKDTMSFEEWYRMFKFKKTAEYFPKHTSRHCRRRAKFTC